MGHSRRHFLSVSALYSLSKYTPGLRYLRLLSRYSISCGFWNSKDIGLVLSFWNHPIRLHLVIFISLICCSRSLTWILIVHDIQCLLDCLGLLQYSHQYLLIRDSFPIPCFQFCLVFFKLRLFVFQFLNLTTQNSVFRG